MRKAWVAFCFLGALFSMAFGQKEVEFAGLDGLQLTADSYYVGDECPTIVLCHQAGWSRGEYGETAVWLNELGFNCFALDQRSGDAVNDINNQTAARAKAAGKGQDYLDAEQDILAAVNYVLEHGAKKVLLLGSSYSASLVLKIAKADARITAVAAFSPGEYFGKKLNLGKNIEGLRIPTFITASQSEMPKTLQLAAHVAPAALTTYSPNVAGHHGSRALWTSKPGYEGYRQALQAWLMPFKNKE